MVGVVKSALDGRAAPNTEFVAQGLSSCYAVNVTEDNLRVVLELSAKGIPIGLHLLAVASPGREELDERRLTRVGDLLLKVVRCELHGRAGDADDRGEQGHARQHGS